MNTTKHRRNRGETGNSIMEFALVSTFLVPVLLGTFTIGMGLNRSLSVASFTRDVGAMFVTNSVDFSQAGAQSIAVRLGSGLGLDNTGNTTGYGGGTSGSGEVILSVVLSVGTRECNTLSGTTLQNQCKTEISNGTVSRYVFTRRIIIGNKNQGGSAFGAPTCAQNADGTIPPASYLTLPLASNCAAINAATFNSALVLNASENAYVVESQFAAPELNLFRLDGSVTPTRFYIRNIF